LQVVSRLEHPNKGFLPIIFMWPSRRRVQWVYKCQQEVERQACRAAMATAVVAAVAAVAQRANGLHASRLLSGSKQATSRLRQVVASVTSGEEAYSEDDTSLNPVNDRGASSSSSDSSSNGEDSQVESEGKTPCTCIAPMLPNVNIPCMLFLFCLAKQHCSHVHLHPTCQGATPAPPTSSGGTAAAPGDGDGEEPAKRPKP
jgi:hypothetical protein